MASQLYLGEFTQHSKYSIVQHHRVGGSKHTDRYLQVLEIKDPPPDFHGIVLHQWTEFHGSTIIEWETLEDACRAFEMLSNRFVWTSAHCEVIPGFKRVVLERIKEPPWFYHF
jgi:hypothetical protein